jgi:hypothetical protein
MSDLTKNDKNPWVYLGTTVGLIVLIWFYFFVQVPYSDIPNTQFFWASFIAWTAFPIAFALRYGWSGSKAGFNFMILIGLIAISLGLAVRWLPILNPMALAMLPGLFTGTIIGVDGWYILARRTNFLRPRTGKTETIAPKKTKIVRQKQKFEWNEAGVFRDESLPREVVEEQKQKIVDDLGKDDSYSAEQSE